MYVSPARIRLYLDLIPVPEKPRQSQHISILDHGYFKPYNLNSDFGFLTHTGTQPSTDTPARQRHTDSPRHPTVKLDDTVTGGVHRVHTVRSTDPETTRQPDSSPTSCAGGASVRVLPLTSGTVSLYLLHHLLPCLHILFERAAHDVRGSHEMDPRHMWVHEHSGS